MKRNFIVCSFVLISFVAGFCIGTNNGTDTDTLNELNKQTKLAECYRNMLHIYWEDLDVETDRDGNVIARHNYFDDVITETDSYIIADSLLNGNWNGFFYNWSSNNN